MSSKRKVFRRRGGDSDDEKEVGVQNAKLQSKQTVGSQNWRTVAEPPFPPSPEPNGIDGEGKHEGSSDLYPLRDSAADEHSKDGKDEYPYKNLPTADAAPGTHRHGGEKKPVRKLRVAVGAAAESDEEEGQPILRKKITANISAIPLPNTAAVGPTYFSQSHTDYTNIAPALPPAALRTMGVEDDENTHADDFAAAAQKARLQRLRARGGVAFVGSTETDHTVASDVIVADENAGYTAADKRVFGGMERSISSTTLPEMGEHSVSSIQLLLKQLETAVQQHNTQAGSAEMREVKLSVECEAEKVAAMEHAALLEKAVRVFDEYSTLREIIVAFVHCARRITPKLEAFMTNVTQTLANGSNDTAAIAALQPQADAILEHEHVSLSTIVPFVQALVAWKADEARAAAYAHSFAYLSTVEVITPWIQLASWQWCVTVSRGGNAPLEELPWLHFVFPLAEQQTNTATEAAEHDAHIIQACLQTAVLPMLCQCIRAGLDVASTSSGDAMSRLFADFNAFEVSQAALSPLRAAIAQTCLDALQSVPTEIDNAAVNKVCAVLAFLQQLSPHLSEHTQTCLEAARSLLHRAPERDSPAWHSVSAALDALAAIESNAAPSIRVISS